MAEPGPIASPVATLLASQVVAAHRNRDTTDVDGHAPVHDPVSQLRIANVKGESRDHQSERGPRDHLETHAQQIPALDAIGLAAGALTLAAYAFVFGLHPFGPMLPCRYWTLVVHVRILQGAPSPA